MFFIIIINKFLVKLLTDFRETTETGEVRAWVMGVTFSFYSGVFPFFINVYPLILFLTEHPNYTRCNAITTDQFAKEGLLDNINDSRRSLCRGSVQRKRCLNTQDISSVYSQSKARHCSRCQGFSTGRKAA